MARSPLARAKNSAGHSYIWYAEGSCHICRDCGTAEHRNGRFYYVGRWSMTEPPCEGNFLARESWLKESLPDDD